MKKTTLTLAITLFSTFADPALADLDSSLGGAAQKEAGQKAANIVEEVTTADMKRILRKEGFEVLKVDDDGDIIFKMEGVRVYFIKSQAGNAIFLRAAWSGSDANLASINQWNMGKRYSRAYLDDDGDPVLQADLDLAGGVTEARVTDFFLTMRLLINHFKEEVL